MLPADGDFGAAFGPARLAMLADGAEITKGCQKPDIKLTIDPDASLADRLNPARDDWQQIYQLLKAQKTSIQSDGGDGMVSMSAGAGFAQDPTIEVWL